MGKPTAGPDTDACESRQQEPPDSFKSRAVYDGSLEGLGLICA